MRTLPIALSALLCLPGAALAQDVLSHDPLSDAIGEVERASAERARAQAELETLVEQRGAVRRRLRERVRALHRMRRAGALPLSEGFDALLRHQSRLNRLEQLLRRDVEGLRTLERRVAGLREESVRLAAQVEESEQRAAELRQAEESQLALLSQLVEDPVAHPDAFGLRPSDGAGPAGLSSQHGNLPLPVGGSARRAAAARAGGAGRELAATPGGAVRAVHPGRVAYAAAHPAYGNLVILDHGDGHYTVYGGLGVVAARVGQSVPADAAIGAVGAQPLFFQVRRGTRALDARRWLGL